MRKNWFAAGLLAAVGVLAWGGTSRAGDIFRPNMGRNAPARRLIEDGRGADTIRAWHRGFGYGGLGWGGLGYGGWGWGGLGYGGLGWGGLGWGGLGYRGLGWGGYYRPYYGFGLGYGGLGYGLGFGGLGFSRFGLGGFYPGFGLGYGGFFGPCSGGISAGVYTLNIPAITLGSRLPGAPQPQAQAPLPGQPRDDGTFPYDGGPSNPVPTPKDAPPTSTTPRSIPLEGRAVSLPKEAPKWSYPAYGEVARRSTPASGRTYLTRGEHK